MLIQKKKSFNVWYIWSNALHVACAKTCNRFSSLSLYFKFGDDFMLVNRSNVIGSITQDAYIFTLLITA